QAGEGAQVDLEAGREGDGGVAPREGGEPRLELLVQVERAVQQPGAGAAGAVARQRGGGGLLHLRVVGEAEIVVGAEHHEPAPVGHRDLGVLRGRDRPVVGVEIGGAQLARLRVVPALLEDVQAAFPPRGRPHCNEPLPRAGDAWPPRARPGIVPAMHGDTFRGTRALVTGGSSGIGRAIALALARAGAHVAIVARRPGPLEEARAALRAAAPDAAQRFAAIAADVADPEQAARAVAEAVAALGGLDLLVNNAGAARALRFVDTPLAEFRRLLDLNFLAAVTTTRAALPHLGAGARIANVSSLAGALAIYGYAAYAPSKFALTAFSEVLRQELRPRGITVAVLLPPDTDTPQLAE